MDPEERAGLHHSAVFVDSEDGLCRLMAESARDALASSEGVVITADEARRQRIMSLMGEGAGEIRFTDATARYTSPRSAMHGLVTVVAEQLRAGHARIRSIGEVRPGTDRHSEWIRYEAAINEVLAEYPLTGVCVYDTQLLSHQTRRAVEETHRYVGGTSPWGKSEHFRDPRQIMAGSLVRQIHPDREPDLLLSDVSELRPVRATAAGLAPPGRSDDSALVVHELVAMALTSTAAAPQVRIWSEPDLLAVQILSSDGFDDPFAGLRPAQPGDGNAAFWIAGQLADDLTVARIGPLWAVTVVFDGRRAVR